MRFHEKNSNYINNRHTQFIQNDKNENERKIYKLSVCLETSEDKNPIVKNWRMDFGFDGEWTPLLAAARYGHLDTCLSIMDSLDVINPGTSEKSTPLHAAATGGHVQICSVILEKLGNQDPTVLNPEDIYLSTPLHNAAMKNRVQVFKVLLDVAWNKNPADSRSERTT